MTPKELADKQSEIIFEDGKVLFIKVKGYDAMEYYASDRLKGEYNKFNRYGDIYLIIDKDGDNSYVMNQVRNGYTDVFDFDGMVNNFIDIIQDYPQLESKLVEFIKPENVYQMLLLIKAGKKVERWELREVDNNLYDITFNEKNPGKSMIQLLFDMDEYINFFSYYEDSWDEDLISIAFGGGSDDDGIYSSDYVYQDWKEGYILQNFNDENLKLLDEIVSFVAPQLLEMKNKDTDKFYQNVAQLFSDNFSRETEDISDEYQDLKNDGADEAIIRQVTGDTADVFRDYGVFRNKGMFTYYVTTVSVLLGIYSMSGNKTASIKELFEGLGKEMDLNIGGYNEVGMQDGDFDNEKFNEVVKNILENILVDIASEPEKYEKTKEYGGVLKQLDKLGYEIGRQYQLPYDKTKLFRIEKIEKDPVKIILIHWDGMRGQKRSYTYEDFVNYLQSPELFETIVKRLKRIV